MQYLFFVRVQKQWGEKRGEEVCFSAPLHINATTACGAEGGRKFSSFSLLADLIQSGGRGVSCVCDAQREKSAAEQKGDLNGSD